MSTATFAELVAAARAQPSIPDAAPWPTVRSTLTDFLPGAYALTGPSPSGRTQFLYQWANHLAARGVPTLLVAPGGRAAEVAARLLGVRRGVRWTTLLPLAADQAQAPDLIPDRTPRIVRLPAPWSAIQAWLAAPAARARAVMVDDAAGDGPLLSTVVRARQLAADAHASIVLVLPAGSTASAPVRDALDGVLCLARGGAAGSATLVVDKWRSRPPVAPLSVPLRFDGTRFEEEPEDFALELSDVSEG